MVPGTKEKNGPAWDVVVTAAGVSLATYLFRGQEEAGWTLLSTAPAIAAGLFRKRFFAYSLLLGSAGSALTRSALPYLLMFPVAGTFLGAAVSRRTPGPNDSHH